MTIKLNNEVRNDIDVIAGGNLSLTSEHKSSSALSIKTPVNAEIRECDYIEIADSENIIFSGTILGVDQENLGYGNLAFKILHLSVSSPSDHVASVFVDLAFPAGSSVQQILMGNHPGDKWYNSAAGQYNGIFDGRIAPEGIKQGVIDDFSNIIVENGARFWGQYVSDALDEICASCNAWWEITPDKFFNIRYAESHPEAPFSLDADAAASDISASHDAYTLYSAVRVVGGQGVGGRVDAQVYKSGSHNWKFGNVELVNNTTLKLRYPINNMATNIEYQGYGAAIVQPIGNLKYQVYNVGFKGLHDENSAYQALASQGGDVIELKSDAVPFSPLPESKVHINSIFISYNPLVDIYARLVDQGLASEIQDQRGGTGIIEYLLEDKSITDFSDALKSASGFLQSNGKRAKSVKFTTLISGFSPGQVLHCNVPYYGVIGDYIVGSVSAESMILSGEKIIWKYNIEASTVDFRDTNLKLFSRSKKMNISVGNDFPAIDGIVLESEVRIQTTLTVKIFDAPTWLYRNNLDLTWQEWENEYQSWEKWEEEGFIEEVVYTGTYLTDVARARLAIILNNGSAQINIAGNLRAFNDQNVSIGLPFSPSGTPYVQGNSVYSTYYIGESQAQELIKELRIQMIENGNIVEMQKIPVSIDKRPNNPKGEYAISISKIDTVI